MRGAGVQPHKTYHGPARNKASTFTPATLHCPPDHRPREQNKEKPRGPGEHPLFPGPIGGRGSPGGGGCTARAAGPQPRTRSGAGTRARGREGVSRAAPRGVHAPGSNPAPSPQPLPATAATEGCAEPGRRRRPWRRRRRPRGEAPPASRRAQAPSGGPASERRRPRRPRATAAGGDGPRRPKGRSRRPSRTAGRRRRCAGSCCSCNRSPGAAPRVPSASRPWTPEAARGLKAAAAAAPAEGKWNPGPGRGARHMRRGHPGQLRIGRRRRRSRCSARSPPSGRGCLRAGEGARWALRGRGALPSVETEARSRQGEGLPVWGTAQTWNADLWTPAAVSPERVR